MKLSTKIILPLILISALLILLTGCFGVPADESPGYTAGSIKGTMARPEICCEDPQGELVGDPIDPNICDEVCKPQDTIDWYVWANVKIVLTTWVDSEEVELATTVTDENGDYLFTDVPPGKNYIITAVCPTDEEFVVKDVAEEVVSGSSYDAGIADAESTVLALCLEGLGEIGLNSDILVLNDFRSHGMYWQVVEEVCSYLADCDHAIPMWVCEITELCPGWTPGEGGEGEGEPDTYTLTMAVNPPEGGTTNPSVGTHTYDEGTVVTLAATAATCYDFVGWTGDVTSSNNPTSVTMNSDKTVTANFEPSLPATADAGGPYSDEVCPGTDALIDLTGSGTGTGTLYYAWDLDEDGQFDDSTEQNPQDIAFGVGVHTVVLQVTDDCGSTTDETTVTITEITPPTADAGPDQCIQLGCESEVIVDFDGSGSSGACLTYDWDFGDGNYGTGSNPSHTYPAGTYDVTLTVTDICGNTDSDTMLLTIHGSCGDLPQTLTFATRSNSATHYFKATFSAAGGDIEEDPTLYYGWCAHSGLSGLPVAGSTMYAYCTLELDKYWDKINYIINNRDGYTRMQVQRAIWHYIHGTAVSGGAADLVADADANGDGFCPGEGEKYVVLLTFEDISYYDPLYRGRPFPPPPPEQSVLIEVDWVDHCPQ